MSIIVNEHNERHHKPLRILFASHENGIGGSTISLVLLISTIKELYPYVSCEVILPQRPFCKSKASELFEKKGIACKEILYGHCYKLLGKPYLAKYMVADVINRFSVKFIEMLIKKNQYDLVCTNSSACSVSGEASVSIEIPHIQYIREMMEEDYGYEYRNKIKQKGIIERSSGVIFNSDYVKDKYIQLYKIKKYKRIYNGFDLNAFHCTNHTLFEDNVIHFLQLGSYRDGKGTKNSIEIMKMLKERWCGAFELVFAGNGSQIYVKEMEEMICEFGLSENIKILDFSADVKNLLLHADILLMNSVAEGFGRVTVEGMLAGCLVVGRDCGGTKEILKNDENGVLFSDESEAVDQILKIVSNKEKYKEVASTGQHFAIEKFSSERYAKDFMDFCWEILEK